MFHGTDNLNRPLVSLMLQIQERGETNDDLSTIRCFCILCSLCLEPFMGTVVNY